MLLSTETSRELRLLLKLGRPLIAGQVLLFGTNVTDTLLAGHLGAEVLGAVGIGNATWMLPLMALQGLMFAVPAQVSHLLGAGLRHQTGMIFRQALYLALGFGMLMSVLIWVGTTPLVVALGLEPGLASGVSQFLGAVAFGAPALGVFMAARGFSDGLSFTKPAMWFGVASVLLLLPLGYMLMYGALGVAGMGALGSGIATAIVLWVEALAFLIFIAHAPAYRDIGWRSGTMAPHLPTILQLLRLGVPMATTVLLESSLFAAASFAVSSFGAVAEAAHQTALNIGALSFMVPLGLSGAITVRVGDAMGAGDLKRARLAGRLGLAVVICTQSISCAVMLLLPETIAAIYSNDTAVQAGTVSLLLLAAMFQLSDGVQVAANGALRGLHDTKYPPLITLVAYWCVGMPVGMFLAFEAGMQTRGIWLGLVAGLSAAALLLTWRFERRTLAALQHGDKVGA